MSTTLISELDAPFPELPGPRLAFPPLPPIAVAPALIESGLVAFVDARARLIVATPPSPALLLEPEMMLLPLPPVAVEINEIDLALVMASIDVSAVPDVPAEKPAELFPAVAFDVSVSEFSPS